MKITQTTLTFDTAAQVTAAQAKLDAAYDTHPVIYTRMGLKLVVQPQTPAIDDLSPLISLITASSSSTSSEVAAMSNAAT